MGKDVATPERIALRFVQVAALVIVMGIGAGCNGGGTEPDFGANNPDMHVAIGDSITEGYRASVDYPSILSALIGKPVVNASLGGTMTRTGAYEVGDLLARFQPGHLLILYGANDAIHGVSLTRTSGNLRFMVQTSKTNSTVPVIATLTPMSGSHEGWNGGVEAINGEIRRIAEEEQVPLADLSAAFAGHPEYMNPDGLHPNNAGQQRIAEVFAEQL